MKKSKFEQLAESILETRILSKQELTTQIEVYFKLWHNELIKNSVDKNDPSILRDELIKEREFLGLKKLKNK